MADLVIIDVLEKHPLLRLHPDFVQHYADFATLVDKSLKDLLDKAKGLEQLRESFKAAKGFSNRRNRNYVSCQLFMLQRHSARLEDFVSEVNRRLGKILGLSGFPSTDWLPQPHSRPRVDAAAMRFSKKALGKNCKTLSLPEIRVEVEANLRGTTLNLAKEEFGTRRPSRSSLSSLSSHSESEDSFNASHGKGPASPEVPLPEEEDALSPSDLDGKAEKIAKLMADIEKMKRRCKHILDVTDKFCILTPESLSISDVDGPPEVSAAPKSPMETNPNLVKVTLESIGSHLAVFTKTYTSRHSTGAASPKSPGEF